MMPRQHSERRLKPAASEYYTPMRGVDLGNWAKYRASLDEALRIEIEGQIEDSLATIASLTHGLELETEKLAGLIGKSCPKR